MFGSFAITILQCQLGEKTPKNRDQTDIHGEPKRR